MLAEVSTESSRKMRAEKGNHIETKKPLDMSGFLKIISVNYSSTLSGNSSSLTGVVAGVAGSGATSSTCSVISLFSSSVVVLPTFTMFMPNTSTNKAMANVQVLLSKKSVVFLTPPNICGLSPPPKAEPNTPPLGFCTSTTSVSNTQTNTIKIVNNKVIISCFRLESV